MSQDILVTTADLKQEYEILEPVYFQTTNQTPGVFRNPPLLDLFKKYESEIESREEQGLMGGITKNHVSEWGQQTLEVAFFVTLQELKKRAALLGADAIIGLRQDIVFYRDSFFTFQVYGTAVKLK